MTNHMTNLPTATPDSAPYLQFANDYGNLYGNIKQIREGDKACGYAVWTKGQWKRYLPEELYDDMLRMFVHGNKQVARPKAIVNDAFSILTASTPRTDEMDWDRCLTSIPLADGNRSLCLNTGIVIDTPEDAMMTRKLNVWETEIANDDEYEHSKFKAFVHDWLEDPARLRFAQLALAQALLGNPTSTIMDMWGTGRNGKGALFQFIKAALGEFCINLDPKLYIQGKSKHESEKTGLKYARVAITGEFDSGTNLDTASLKSETGGEGLTVSRKGKDPYEVVPIALYMIHGNTELNIRDNSKGIRERWKRLKFTKTYGNDVRIGKTDMEAIATRERGVYLRWIIDGLKEFHACDRKYTNIGTVIDDTKVMFDDNSVITNIIREYLIEVPGYATSIKELYETTKLDDDARWKSSNALVKKLRESGFTIEAYGKGGFNHLMGWMFRDVAKKHKLIKDYNDTELLGYLDDEGKVVLHDTAEPEATETVETPWNDSDEDVPAPKRKSDTATAKNVLAQLNGDQA